MEQIDIKSGRRTSLGVELVSLKAEERTIRRFVTAPPRSVCRQRFRDTTMVTLGVESLVEHDYEG